MIPVSPKQIEPDPIEIDPRPCVLCGRTIDQHEMIDHGDGPLFFCAGVDDGVADIVRRLELADPRDAWRHTGDPAPPIEVRNGPLNPRPPRAEPDYPAQSTIDSFWYVVGLRDPERLREWLADHPKDAPFLTKLLEGK
jgi:hypothetical protein